MIALDQWPHHSLVTRLVHDSRALSWHDVSHRAELPPPSASRSRGRHQSVDWGHGEPGSAVRLACCSCFSRFRCRIHRTARWREAGRCRHLHWRSGCHSSFPTRSSSLACLQMGRVAAQLVSAVLTDAHLSCADVWMRESERERMRSVAGPAEHDEAVAT